jgi:hypothetical protein
MLMNVSGFAAMQKRAAVEIIQTAREAQPSNQKCKDIRNVYAFFKLLKSPITSAETNVLLFARFLSTFSINASPAL